MLYYWMNVNGVKIFDILIIVMMFTTCSEAFKFIFINVNIIFITSHNSQIIRSYKYLINAETDLFMMKKQVANILRLIQRPSRSYYLKWS